MSAAIRAVVFDLDGTLLDSMPLVLRAYQHALAPYVTALTDGELLRRMGGPPRRIFEQLIDDRTHVSAALHRLDAYAMEAWQQIEPFPGMIPAVDDLRAAGCRLAIWTGRERASTEWLLRRHGLAARIQVAVCGDDLPSHKPDPAGLAEALRLLGVSAGEAVFVGDAGVDVRAGVQLGVRTVFIRHSPTPVGEDEAGAWQVADTPGAAYDFLRRQVSPDTRSA